MVGVETAREADGLALSSRNVRLTPAHRAAAPALPAALREAASTAASARGPVVAAELVAAVRLAVESAGGEVDYVEVADAESLAGVAELAPGGAKAVLAVAARFGAVRLIDNVELAVPAQQGKESACALM